MADVNEDAGWVPRPHPRRMLYIRRGNTLVGFLDGKVAKVHLNEDGSYHGRKADGSYVSISGDRR